MKKAGLAGNPGKYAGKYGARVAIFVHKTGIVAGFLRDWRQNHNPTEAEQTPMGLRLGKRAGILLALLCMSSSLATQTAATEQDFTFKRVKPPKSGSKKRITVQIAPAPLPQVQAPTTAEQKPGPSSGVYDWFWAKVSPKLDTTGAARLEPAMAALTYAPPGKGAPAPRLQDIQGIVAAQGVEILKATVGTQVSPALALAVISVESGGRVDAVSSAGAQGLMQLMPATAERFGVTDAAVAADNIKGGVAFLDFLMKKFDGDPILVLAGYNAGENSIAQHDGVPPYAETRAYIPKVLAAYAVARGFCKTQPLLFSDGCVFVTMN